MQCFDDENSFSPQELSGFLRDASEAYFHAVCAAEKMNGITTAHKHHLSSALDRAASCGKIVDMMVRMIKNEF